MNTGNKIFQLKRIKKVPAYQRKSLIQYFLDNLRESFINDQNNYFIK